MAATGLRDLSDRSYMTIVITIPGSGWVRPTSDKTPPDGLRPQVGPPQPSPLSSLPDNGSDQLAWQAANTGARVANNMAHINWSGGAALPAASGSTIFLFLVQGCELLATINFYPVPFSSNVSLPILTPETILKSAGTMEPV